MSIDLDEIPSDKMNFAEQKQRQMYTKLIENQEVNKERKSLGNNQKW